MRHLLLISLCVACGTEEEPEGIAALGGGTHDVRNIKLTVIATDDDGLNVPRDLEFSPAVQNELWVVNQEDDSTTIISGAGTNNQSSRHVIDPWAIHFMDEVSSIAFGAAMFDGSDLPNFATCQESLNTYNDQFEGDEFMGPTLWTSDPDLFGESNPEAVEYLSDLWDMYADLGSHLDMLHEMPLCTGIAWETENVYWVMNGRDGAINRADFQEDHGPGFDDHDDGIIDRYAKGEFSREPNVPSHLEFDSNSGFLYIADTGNNAIKVLDTTTGTQGDRMYGGEPAVSYHEWEDALVWTLIDGDAVNMSQPSGLALVEDTLLITDHHSGTIYAFDLDGELIDWLDTGREEAIMGIVGRSLDDLWVVDARADEVLRLQP